jgi:hypothetical protein
MTQNPYYSVSKVATISGCLGRAPSSCAFSPLATAKTTKTSDDEHYNVGRRKCW